jgi:hypothetical protein
MARLLHNFSTGKIEFAVSLDSLFSKTIQSWFPRPVSSNSSLFRFVKSLVASLKIVGIEFEAGIRDVANHLFETAKIDVMSISGEIVTPLTDSRPDVLRADSFAWALSEALLRTMYNSQFDSIMIDKMMVDSGIWARIIGKIPRVAPFKEPDLVGLLAHWMREFASVRTDEWISSQCFAPYSATDAEMILYNPVEIWVYLTLCGAALVYGLLVFMAMARHKVLALGSDTS